MEISEIIIASDHAGFELKEHLKFTLKDKQINVVDIGTDSTESCNYPIFAKKLCNEVLSNNCFGILICGTGIGMSMTANRFNKIRATLCTSKQMAQLSRQHNNANVLCIGARITGKKDAEEIVNTFLNTDFDTSNKRHKNRIAMFDYITAQK